jgi:dihydrofolate synthase/folylpolyglutamate synthase
VPVTASAAYEALLRRLILARRFGVRLGLERMRELLDRLGAPDRRLGRVVHVGGTNGKGSTVAMVAAIARAAGLRVATYTSPHLSSLRERVTIGGAGSDGEMLDEATWCAVAARVHAAGGDDLTFFEQVTAIAFVAIAEAGVDVSVLEVGLGGRFDATNVVAAELAAVTGVAMDHAAILGDTLAAIAGEKAGIFKPGARAYVGMSGEPAAVPVLVEHARAAGCPVVQVTEPWTGPLALAGEHQRRNAALAVALAAELGAATTAAAALATVRHPGRLERVGDVILDGAHNPHGAAALARALPPGAVLVVAASADKDIAGIAAALAPAVTAVVATRYQQDRALDPAALAAAFGTRHVAPDLAAALVLARELAAGAPVVVAGSLFLVGEARVLLLGAPADPVVATEKFAPD